MKEKVVWNLTKKISRPINIYKLGDVNIEESFEGEKRKTWDKKYSCILVIFF